MLARMTYVAAMVAAIVAVDLAFLRGTFWPRLLVNLGIVLVFGAVYLKIFRR